MNTAAPLITVQGLTVGYGSYVVQRDLDFTINRQDVFIIMGPSGCGKSSLLRVLVGLLPLRPDRFSMTAQTSGRRMRRNGRRCSAGWGCSSRAELSGVP